MDDASYTSNTTESGKESKKAKSSSVPKSKNQRRTAENAKEENDASGSQTCVKEVVSINSWIGGTNAPISEYVSPRR